MNDLLFKTMLTVRKLIYTSLGMFDRALGQKNQVFVLAYHSIKRDDWRYSVNPSMFKKQIAYLWKNYEFITLSELAQVIDGKKQLSRPAVVLTFDDGYKDMLALKDFFMKQNIRPTLFVLSDTKKANIKEIGTQVSFLTNREIKSLIKAGWEIGSHSATHSNLTNVILEVGRPIGSPPTNHLYNEIIESKKTLEQELGMQISYFAFPRGKYSKKVLALVKKANYTLALTMDDGFIDTKVNPHLIPRIGIDRTHTFAEFKTTFSPSVVRFRKIIKKTIVGKYLSLVINLLFINVLTG